MKKYLFVPFLLCLSLLLVGCQNQEETAFATATVEAQATASANALIDSQTYAANQRIGRSINLGNALEGPREGAWGLYLKEEYFVEIAEAGFDSVRVPIRWSAYTSVEPPYEISQQIFDRIDWVIEQAFDNDLAVIINVHHFDAIMQMPEIQAERLTEMWRQIAVHYQDYPDTLYFEILNEPNEKLDSAAWNQIFPQALAAIRETNPKRYVIIGPDQWNSVDRLGALELPVEDRRIIATFHFYKPHEFTHQGAPWSSAADIKDRPWGSDAEAAALTADFDAALAWSESQQRPLFIGEFGVYSQVPDETRAVWLSAVREAAELRGFSWAHWDFGTNFAAYNLSAKTWREPILRALIPQE
ncbi:MAG TPA: endoglucanase [Chloroflexi bacterium]|nr:endoglucanase [Chloroflexota bacterium]HBY09419.1 endoglucanase [Chloroflexota bacterium]